MKKIVITALLSLFIAPIIWMAAQNDSTQPPMLPETKHMQTAQHSLVIELKPEVAQQIIINLPNILIIDFYADWCNPCTVMAPIIEELAHEFKGKYSFAKLNVDECPAIAKEYKISSLPTLAIFSSGKLIDKIVGQQSKENIVRRIDQAVTLPQDLTLLDQQTLNEKLIQAIQSIASTQDLKRILEAGADVNTRSAQGLTPLMIIIMTMLPMGLDVVDMIQLLLEYGATTQMQIPGSDQKLDTLEYINLSIQRAKMVLSNCEKIAELLSQTNHNTQQEKASCTSDSCSL